MNAVDPLVRLTEHGYWAYASQLLEEYKEDEVARYVTDRYSACLEAHDVDGATRWMNLVEKIDKLRAASTRKRSLLN